jgi:hypothetical protein
VDSGFGDKVDNDRDNRGTPVNAFSGDPARRMCAENSGAAKKSKTGAKNPVALPENPAGVRKPATA